MDLKNVIKKPLVTEKSTEATSFGRYSFEVDRRADKKTIKQAVEKYFGVHPQRVWLAAILKKGKKRKKAIVQLAGGEKIDLFKTGE